ncbi:hypothetical protein [Mycobacteroides salmoniphilum]|uniref:hypothetical protein n=1 Tax=Mycobacteroides salmoniphilum TaxID=404941 RepID=UPI0010669313|nr:hypothetical protein [Mycobacteroides salmoniphilum]
MPSRSDELGYQFDYVDEPGRIVIGMTESRIWDASTVAALGAIPPSTGPRKARGNRWYKT